MTDAVKKLITKPLERIEQAAEARSRVYKKDEVREQFVYIIAANGFIKRDSDERELIGVEAFNNAVRHAFKNDASPHKKLLAETSPRALRRLDRLIFKPGKGEFVGGCYNLYRDPGIVPSLGETAEEQARAAAALEKINAHLDYMFSEAERDHLLNWMAWFYQNIGTKPKHWLLIAGKLQGTGKTFLVDMFRRVLGLNNTKQVSQSDLSSNFNPYAMDALLLVIEELRAMDTKQAKDRLHDLITEETVAINEKGVKRFQIDNCFGGITMTNEEVAVKIDSSDRRYLIVRTHAVPKPADSGYYRDLYALRDDPVAIAAFAYMLKERELFGYSGREAAPMTTAKEQMLEASASELVQWVRENSGKPPFSYSVFELSEWLDNAEYPAGMRNRLNINVARDAAQSMGCKPYGQVRIGKERPRLWLRPELGSPTLHLPIEIKQLYLEERKGVLALTEAEAEAEAMADVGSAREDFTDDPEVPVPVTVH
jgi:hypothetical protein